MIILKKMAEHKKWIITMFVVGLISGLLNYSTLGAKDTLMFSIATFLLLVCLYLLYKKERKYSIIIFIIGMPFLVMARKVVMFDFLLFRITYESLYITILFATGIKRYISEFINLRNDKIDIVLKISLCLLIIFAYNSSFFSDNIMKSLAEVYSSVLVPLFFFLSIIGEFTKKDIKLIYISLMISLDFSCFYGFLQVLSVRSISNRDMLTFGYHNVNIFAMLLMLEFPLLLEMILYHAKQKREKIFYLISLLVQLMALYVTHTRGAWISAIIVIFILLMSKRYKKVFYAFAAVGLLFSKKIISFVLSRGTGKAFLKSESTIARVQSFYTSLKSITYYPLGVGGDNFPEIYRVLAPRGYEIMPESFRTQIVTAAYTLEAAHNLWLQVMVEYGIITMIAFFIVVIIMAIISFKQKSNRGLFAAVICYMIFSMLTGVEFNHKGVLTHTLVIWIIFAMIIINRKREDSNVKKDN
ncbi:Lipid A core-O-antigen ligase [Clostridium sp. N3C]|uniref:O-antigen ligase family protein n=1 Tax=Clostridium sp. N3C TaxID=1776758 RepID=UPI00092E16CD|nr:O-antigen ligase family protein [Clostridium sp. N3C]SCN23779.1 Lipid A core-O-antigen ligase [Clostridium sp. N3C]